MGNSLQTFAVDTHPQREKIIQALLDNEPPKKIAKWVNPPISHVSIWRYRTRKVKPVLERAVKTAKLLQTANVPLKDDKPTDTGIAAIDLARDALTDDPLLSRVLMKYRRYDRWFDEAERQNNFAALANIDRAETGALTLHGNLSGRLQAPNGSAIQIVIGDGSFKNGEDHEETGMAEKIVDLGIKR